MLLRLVQNKILSLILIYTLRYNTSQFSLVLEKLITADRDLEEKGVKIYYK